MAVHIGNSKNGKANPRSLGEESQGREKRRVVQSHLTLAQIQHGQPPIVWSNLTDCGDFFTVSVRLSNETSAVCFDGKTYRMSSNVGDVRILYLPAVDFVDYTSSRQTLKILLSRSFLNELANDLGAPRITRIGTEPRIARDPSLLKFANLALPCFDIGSPINPLWADQFMWSFGAYVSHTECRGGWAFRSTTNVVKVSAEALLIDPSTASVSADLDQTRLEDIPVLGRNPYITAKLSGVFVNTGNPQFIRFADQNGTSATSVPGGPVAANLYVVDGVPITDTNNRPIVIPTIESIQDVKVQANTYDAQVGRTGGGVFNTLLRSGSNAVHGSVFGETRQGSWLANDFFANREGVPRPDSPYYNWGASLAR